MRGRIILLALFITSGLKAQYNPGYLGKHHAIGMDMQFTPLYKDQRYTAFNLRLEQSLKRSASIEASVGFFSNSFGIKDYQYGLTFNSPDNNGHYGINRIEGSTKFSGVHAHLGLVNYRRRRGAMAPYGKRLSYGIYYNSAKITDDDMTYYDGVLSFKTEKKPYPYKSMAGMYFEFGEKKLLGETLFVQYGFQVNLPVYFTYPYAIGEQPVENNNYQDFLEARMQKSIVRTNTLTIHIGLGCLIK